MNDLPPPTCSLFPWAPSFYPGESFCSWVLRLTGGYQYTFHQLSKLTTIKPQKKDWDLGLGIEQKHHLLQLVGISYCDQPKENIDEIFLRNHGLPLIPRRTKNLPSYAWCDQCFLEDKEPYLRWRWRYQNYTFCLKHKTRLQRTCAMCESFYVVSTALTCIRGVNDAILDLSYCANCGCSLAHTPRDEQDPTDKFFERYVQKIKTMDISATENFDHWLFASKIQSPASQHPIKLFSINSPKLSVAREVGPVWSRNLSRPSRIKLVRAMQIIRSERNKYRRNPTTTRLLD